MKLALEAFLLMGLGAIVFLAIVIPMALLLSVVELQSLLDFAFYVSALLCLGLLAKRFWENWNE